MLGQNYLYAIMINHH